MPDANAYATAMKRRNAQVRGDLDAALEHLARIDTMTDQMRTDSEITGGAKRNPSEAPPAILETAVSLLEEMADFDDAEDFDHDIRRRIRAVVAEL